MGQYQQWLLAQEIDRRLQAEIETLETELFYLQDRMTILEQVVPDSENMILRVLAAHLQQQDQAQPGGETAHTQAEPTRPPAGTGEETLPVAQNEKTIPAFSRALPRDAMAADMLTLLEEHSHATPNLSALFQYEYQHPQAESADDEETRRLNESIQRWFVRWHRQIARTVQEEETDDRQ